MKFAHVGIVVRDLDRMCEFYKNLGFKEFFRIRRDEDWIAKVTGVENADIDIVHLASPGDECRIELLHYHNSPQVWIMSIQMPPKHFAMWVEDIDALHLRAFACGAHPVSETPVEIPDGPNKGMKVCYMADPEGNVFEMMQRPPA